MMVVKEMLTGIKLRNTFSFISERVIRSVIGLEEESLYNFSSEKEQQWQKAMDSYSVGKILVDLKVITLEQLNEVLERQRELQSLGRGKGLGVLLIEMWVTTSKVYLEKLSQHFNIPVLSLGKFIPVHSLQELIGLRYAHRNKVIVVGHNEDEVKLAMAEPNPLLLDELKKLFWRKKVKFYLANPFEVERCLRRYSDPYSGNFYR